METVWTIVAILVSTALFIILPAVLLLRAWDFLLSPPSENEKGILRSMARVPVFILGIVSILFGLSIIVWVLYNIFIEEQEEYSGPRTLLGGLGIGPPCIAFGVLAVRASLRTPVVEEPHEETIHSSDDEWDEQ